MSNEDGDQIYFGDVMGILDVFKPKTDVDVPKEEEKKVDGETEIIDSGNYLEPTGTTVISEDTPIYNPIVTPITEEVIPVADVTPTPDPTPIGEKFMSFREKFLALEKEADSWENQIIEKQTRRVEKYKEFADVLDKENDYLEAFKAEKLG